MGKQYAFFALYEKLTKITDVIGEISLIKDDCFGGPTVDDWKDTDELENLTNQLDVLLADGTLTPVFDAHLGRVHLAVVQIKSWLNAEDWLRDVDSSDERLERSFELLEKGWQEIDEFIRQMARRAFGYWGAEFFSFLEYDERLEIILGSIPQSESVDLEPLLSADDVPDEPIDVPPRRILDAMQRGILKALSGKALKKEELAEAVTGNPCHGNLLYRQRRLPRLLKAGLVIKTPGIGFWRPDSPPKDKLAILFPEDFEERGRQMEHSPTPTKTEDDLPY